VTNKKRTTAEGAELLKAVKQLVGEGLVAMFSTSYRGVRCSVRSTMQDLA
jgi:hypothetical protein